MSAREVYGGSSSASSQQEGCGSGAPAPGGGRAAAEMFGQFQDWCLRTYGDSGKTKTVTRRKYNKILQTLLQGDEENSNRLLLHDKGSTINAKFKFWVKSKGFQVGAAQGSRPGSTDRPVLYVPIKNTVSGPAALSACASFRRVCVELSLDGCGYFSEPMFVPKESGHTSHFCF